MTGQRTTAFITTRPVPTPGVPMQRSSRGTLGRAVPPCILFGFIIASILCSAGRNPFAGLIMILVFCVLIPTLWWGWIWGMGKSNRGG
jgi:hypothetical protein